MVSDKMMVIKMHSRAGGIKEGRKESGICNLSNVASLCNHKIYCCGSKQAGKIYIIQKYEDMRI